MGWCLILYVSVDIGRVGGGHSGVVFCRKIADGEDPGMLARIGGIPHIQAELLEGRTSSEHAELEPVSKIACEM